MTADFALFLCGMIAGALICGYIVWREMREDAQPYIDAMEGHLCEHDMADWLACGRHHVPAGECSVCEGLPDHSHRAIKETI